MRSDPCPFAHFSSPALQAIPAQQTDVQAQREAGKHARQASTMSHHLAEQPDLKRSRKDDATMQQPGHQTFGLEGAISEKQHHASGNPIAVQQAEAARRAKAALELFNAQQVSIVQFWCGQSVYMHENGHTWVRVRRYVLGSLEPHISLRHT